MVTDKGRETLFLRRKRVRVCLNCLGELGKDELGKGKGGAT